MSKTFLFQSIQFIQTVIIQKMQFSKSGVFVYIQLHVKLILFQKIQFSIQKKATSNNSVKHTYEFYVSKQFYFKQISLALESFIWPIDGKLFRAITLRQCWPGSDGNKVAICIPQSYSSSVTSPSDYFVSYPEHPLLGGILSLCREAFSVFYRHSRPGNHVEYEGK